MLWTNRIFCGMIKDSVYLRDRQMRNLGGIKSMRKVVKFGGSSLASAEQFKKVGDIIRADKGRKYVVPSAPGKRFDGDIKVTDMLYACYAKAEKKEDITASIAAIRERYMEIINGLGLSLSLDDQFEVISENFKKLAGSNYAASRGEYLNGIIMANYLGYEFIDAAEVIVFHEDGTFDAETTNEKLSARLAECDNAVIPGFYGATAEGKVTTFSRGGSDITGSLIAKAVHADLYENWTDVSGFLITDPRIIKNPKVIDTPPVTAVAKDGIQLIAKARVTVRANIKQLVGGAGEETILARVGEGIVSSIGSSESHKTVLENPDSISKLVLRKGLDAGTAFEILSIDIADIDIGKNIGAFLQMDQAQADKNIAQAKAEERRAMAVALEQEMKAKAQEARAKVIEAEAEVPKAMADAFRTGNLGVMDYYKMKNIEADTSMREAIAKPTGAPSKPLKD